MIYVPVMLLVAPLVFILLPPIERTTSGSWGLGQALLLILGALAGVELTLAQELQYVLGNTPLQAGMFIIPIMAAAAVDGPNAVTSSTSVACAPSPAHRWQSLRPHSAI
ncbi:hypothetical protein [Aeromonas dhakensis]|uniref:hypothetical protein n=1 Tax=Aeromonas dhakensis TaxID=196024 RepID=UPI0019CFE197|nr:hypothetical protein [Aeromonas dhakensis]